MQTIPYPWLPESRIIATPEGTVIAWYGHHLESFRGGIADYWANLGIITYDPVMLQYPNGTLVPQPMAPGWREKTDEHLDSSIPLRHFEGAELQ